MQQKQSVCPCTCLSQQGLLLDFVGTFSPGVEGTGEPLLTLPRLHRDSGDGRRLGKGTEQRACGAIDTLRVAEEH